MCLQASTQAQESITWRIVDWPPFYILAGPDKGQGIYDVLLNNVIDAMPEYRHKKVVMNTQRLLAEFDKGTQVCSPSALDNTPAYLSKINSYLLPHQLIYHKNDFPSFAYQEKVSLNKLLLNPNFKLGIASERYPQEINAIIAAHAGQKNIIKQNNYNSLVKMFFRRRFDALIEYPPVINYSKHMLGLSLNNESVAIAEISDVNYLPVHFACTDNSWGREVINKINRILVDETKQLNFLAPRLRWYEGKDRKALKEHYDQHYFDDKKRL